MSALLDSYIQTADAIARLFAPHVEVVVHDLKRSCIHHIANCFSKRRIGNTSLTDIHDIDLTAQIIGPYAKTNWDGRRLKSVSIVIRNDAQKPVGLLCINHDTEAFSQVLEQMMGLVSPPLPLPAATTLFASDWREKINELVGAFLAERNITMAGMTSDDVNSLLANLDRARVFDIRHAVDYIGDIIGCSRATVYNRLKIMRSRGKNNAKSNA